MVLFHYVEIYRKFLLPPIVLYSIYDHENINPDEPVNINIQSLVNIIQESNWVIITKNGKGKLPLFCGNREQVIKIYDIDHVLGWNFTTQL